MILSPQPKPPKHKKQNKREEWITVRDTEIVPQFVAWGITMCELGLNGCRKYIYLGFAHTKKRRHISSPDDLRRVVLACDVCHNLAEYFCMETTGQTMTVFLEGIIRKREERLMKRG